MNGTPKDLVIKYDNEKRIKTKLFCSDIIDELRFKLITNQVLNYINPHKNKKSLFLFRIGNTVKDYNNNLNFQKLTNFEKFKLLIKKGTDKIYLSQIVTFYKQTFGLSPYQNDIKKYMSKLNYVSLFDVKGKIYYDSAQLSGNIIYKKVLTKKPENLIKLEILVKRGISKIYLSKILEVYQETYGLIPYQKDIKNYMLKLGHIALLDIEGKIYYDFIQFTKKMSNRDFTNFIKFRLLVKDVANTIYLSEIIKKYQKMYDLKISKKEVKSYMMELGFIAQLDSRKKIYYSFLQFSGSKSTIS
jgi:hypothetical protein